MRRQGIGWGWGSRGWSQGTCAACLPPASPCLPRTLSLPSSPPPHPPPPPPHTPTPHTHTHTHTTHTPTHTTTTPHPPPPPTTPTCRIFRRASSEGMPTEISRSKRPARRSAGSRASGLQEGAGCAGRWVGRAKSEGLERAQSGTAPSPGRRACKQQWWLCREMGGQSWKRGARQSTAQRTGRRACKQQGVHEGDGWAGRWMAREVGQASGQKESLGREWRTTQPSTNACEATQQAPDTLASHIVNCEQYSVAAARCDATAASCTPSHPPVGGANDNHMLALQQPCHVSFPVCRPRCARCAVGSAPVAAVAARLLRL